VKNILVVEDNELNLELMREVLEARGFKIAAAVNGQEAIGKIAECLPDLVLLDIQMPVLDGFATIRAIRQNHPKLKVLALTAFAMDGDRDRVISAGFDGYISKPIEADLLVGTIAEHLGP
jgi:two-component system cell cycle response regulator DivK